ncbi:MAG: secretin N-terminal domain-containing protein [Tepidisphaeraceae bacterium]
MTPVNAATSRPAETRPTTGPVTFSLNFKDAPLDAVLNYFSQTIGFEILRDGPIDARVTMMSKQPVSAEEAVTMLSAALKVNGFTVIRENHMLRVSSLDKAKRGGVPVHFGAKPADVADTEELIMQVIPLANISATKLRDDLKPLLGSDADITANEGSNTIIITDVSSRIRRLVQMISQIDLHEAQTSEIRIIQLKHASASAISKLLDTLFKSPSAQPQQQNQRFGPQQQPPQPEAAASERHGQTVITAADDRTNTLLVVASSETLTMIDGIVSRLDAESPNPASTPQMRVYTLKFADAEATAKVINTVFTPPKPGSELPFLFIDIGPGPESKKEVPTNAVADDRTNSVIVTAPLERLKDVDELVQRLDTSPMAGVEVRSIHLRNADAEITAKLLQDMFMPKKEEQNAPQLSDFFSFQPPTQQKERGIKISINADERTNILFISAPREWLDMIEKVAHEVDAENTTEDVLFIYRLRNAQAQHLEYTLNVLFGNNAPPPQNNQQNSQNQQQNALMQQNQMGNRGNSSSVGNQASPNNPSNRNNRNQPQSATLPPGVARATSELTGNVLVVAEPDTNSLLVTTSRKYEAQVRSIITELDRPVPQVLIKCLVAEVTHDNSQDFGVDFSVLNLRPSGNGQALQSTLGAAAAAASTVNPGGLVVKVLESNVTAILQALAQENKLDVLSRPYILTSDNQEAAITVGDEVPFVTDSFTDVNGGVHNTVQYQDLGVILDVTPHINPDGLVIMDVDPQISSLTGQTVTIQAGVSVPVYELRSAQSRVAIDDGQTIVIGGLMQDQKTENINKIPLLGDIPLLGALFSYRTKSKTKTELLIFLTPHAVMEPGGLLKQSKDEVGGLRLTPGAVEPGTMQDQLRGMSRGSTTAPSAPLPLPPPAPPGGSW